jgi:hypothetical protein
MNNDRVFYFSPNFDLNKFFNELASFQLVLWLRWKTFSHLAKKKLTKCTKTTEAFTKNRNVALFLWFIETEIIIKSNHQNKEMGNLKWKKIKLPIFLRKFLGFSKN